MSTKYIVHTGDLVLDVTLVEHEGYYEIDMNGKTYRVDASGGAGGSSRSLLIDGRAYEAATIPGRDGLDVYVSGDGIHVKVVDELWARAEAESGAEGGGEKIVSPMPGSVVKVLVQEGDTVEPGRSVVVVEAMKMQNELAAVRGGTVASIHVKEGDVVDQDTLLVVLDAEGA